jgi:ATP-dependent Clp protease ATP-binding subunit ClpC
LTGGLFDRIDFRVKRVLALALNEAVLLNHNWIGPEHVLLGLVGERDGVAARSLGSLGIELSPLRLELERTFGRGQARVPPSDITLTPRTKKVVELAIDEARKVGSGEVSTEHMLLGLLRDESIAVRMLAAQGLTKDQVRDEVRRTLKRPPETSG